MENIVIIGAGVVGLSCAYYLLKSGEKVTLVEQGFAGFRQPTRPGVSIRYLNGKQESIKMSFLIESFWKNFESEFDVSINYQATGHLFLTSHQQKFEEFCNVDQDDPLDVNALDERQIKTEWPHLGQLIQDYGIYSPIGRN